MQTFLLFFGKQLLWASTVAKVILNTKQNIDRIKASCLICLEKEGENGIKILT